MKNTLYNPSKIARVITGVLMVAFIGIFPKLQATDTDPTPSESVGGRTATIINKSNYNIDVSLTMWNPHHSTGHQDLNKSVPANKAETLGPTNGCNAGWVGWTNSCFWGADRVKENVNSDELKIKSKDFPDPNKTYTIKISQNNGKGTIALESQTERNKKGYCKYRMLEWTAEWKNDHYEVTFNAIEGDTSRPRATCKQ